MFNPNEHLMDLKGKQYLQVMWRLVWFREEKPLWSIDTKLEQLTDNHAVFSAKISDENGVQKASGYGSEGVKDFKDFIEKAETKAIGRALAMLGYGTQFAPELDEEERIVDSPVPKKAAIPQCTCKRCNKAITPINHGGRLYSAEEIVANSKKAFNSELCWACMKELRVNEQERAAFMGDPNAVGF
jgi:hypothetical protein